jgi:putative hydrolase of the HAD superfamily
MRAVLFDLGNTLVSYYAASEFAPILRECLRSCASVVSREPIEDEEALFRRAWALNVEREDHVVWPLSARLRELFGEAAADVEVGSRLCDAFLAPVFATAKVNPDALSVLATLRDRGIRTAIVSNTPWGSPAGIWREELRRHGLLDSVDAAVFCVDVGHRKPHPAAIEEALRQLMVPKHEAVFVGDDPRWDVAGAQRAGVQPILLSRQPPAGWPDSIPVASSLRDVLRYAEMELP